MKRRISMIVILMMAICNMVWAEDKVTINDFKISAGETKEASITLDNEADYVAFQFDLYLPEGISVESYEANRTRLPETTTLSMSKQADGCYRFLSAAMQAEPIVGRSGTIVTLTVKASGELEHGEKTGYFRNVKLSKQDATGPTYTEMSFPITIIEPSIVTVTSVTREYGNTNPIFEYTVTGGALEGTPEITCEANPTSPVGTYPIVVSKGSIKNYSVTYVDGTLTITKAPLTISGGTYSMKQGDALPDFKAEYDGFKNDETEEVLTTKPTLTTTATSASAPGEYEVTVSGAEATNYEITYKAGKLVITDADAITVTVKNASRKYGDANPAFEYEISGGTAEQLDGTPELTCEAVATSGVGEYAIKAAKGTATYPNIVFVDGTLTITKAPLTISGGTYSMKQGDALPEFKAEYDGFKNEETEDVLTTKPMLTTTATSASAPGEYEVTVSGAEAANYEMTYVAGTLKITQDSIVVDNIGYEETEDGIVVKNGENSSGDVVIPATIEVNGQTYQITGIGEGAFKGNTAITSVSIANGITQIGASAFEGCSNLTEIILGMDVTIIGEKAFANFAPPTDEADASPRRAEEVALTIYCYPMSVPETAFDAFENTPIDKSMLVVYDEVLEEYGVADLWSKFGNIQGFNGESIIRIDNIAYHLAGEVVTVVKGGNNSESVTIPATVEYNGLTYQITGIGKEAFKGNTAIMSVTISNGISKIGASAFEACINLTEINIGADVTSIGEKAFANIVASANEVPRRADEVVLTVNCYAVSVPETAMNAFENTPVDKAKLFVEDNSVNDYSNAYPWKHFGTIQGFNGGTGIISIWAAEDNNATIYSLDGKQLDKPQKGLNIVRMDDGTVMKVLVK